MTKLTMAEIIEAIKAATPEEKKQLADLLIEFMPAETLYNHIKT